MWVMIKCEINQIGYPDCRSSSHMPLLCITDIERLGGIERKILESICVYRLYAEDLVGVLVRNV